MDRTYGVFGGHLIKLVVPGGGDNVASRVSIWCGHHHDDEDSAESYVPKCRADVSLTADTLESCIFKLKVWLVLGFDPAVVCRTGEGGHRAVAGGVMRCNANLLTDEALDRLRIGDGTFQFQGWEVRQLRKQRDERLLVSA